MVSRSSHALTPVTATIDGAAAAAPAADTDTLSGYGPETVHRLTAARAGQMWGKHCEQRPSLPPSSRLTSGWQRMGEGVTPRLFSLMRGALVV